MTTTMKDLPSDMMTQIVGQIKHDPVYKIEYNSVENTADTDGGDEDGEGADHYVGVSNHRDAEVLVQLKPVGSDEYVLNSQKLQIPTNVEREFLRVFFNEGTCNMPDKIRTHTGADFQVRNTLDWLREKRFIMDTNNRYQVRMVHIKKIERIA